MSKTISLDGQYILEIEKYDSGRRGVIILKKHKNGICNPILSFPATVKQENEAIGVQLEFNADDIFIE